MNTGSSPYARVPEPAPPVRVTSTSHAAEGVGLVEGVAVTEAEAVRDGE